jgi:hypothetical protein
MKQLPLASAVLSISVMSVVPVWARTCPKFIKEGKDLLAKAKLSQAKVGFVTLVLFVVALFSRS